MSSPSFQSRLTIFYMIRDILNSSNCLLFPSPLLVTVYRKICVVTKEIRQGNVGGPPLALQTGSEVTAETPTMTC